ncbi:uncharacterized protein LOC105703086 [Orussus abietinus]|uniref:uncharacterized protein LOC105703086 n=1 Tax=Orussus abietinus TaxID=222816 RepID=UPI000625D3A7|nr:uncharacterized protein LOC105703086 [Orussus abietinus]
MRTRLTGRSVSEDSLGNILKHIIEEALEDTEQVAKLHGVLFEDWYIKKTAELEEAKATKKRESHSQDEEEKDAHPEPGMVSTEQTFPPLKIQKSKSASRTSHNYQDRMPSQRSLALQISELGKSANFRYHETFSGSYNIDHSTSKIDIGNKSKSSMVQQVLSEIFLKNGHAHEVIFPVQSTNGSFKDNSDNKNFTKSLVTVERYAAECCYQNIPQNDNSVYKNSIVTASSKENKQINDLINNNIDENETQHPEMEITEIWNSVKQNVKYEIKRLDEIKYQNKLISNDVSSKGNKIRNGLPFEAWKREKTRMYKNLFREKQRERQLQQAARAKEMEKKQAAKEAYLSWRKQREVQHKLTLKRKKALDEVNDVKRKRNCEETTSKAQAFKMWKKKKDAKLRENDAANNHPVQYNQPSLQSEVPKMEMGLEFHSWLDQLDYVLHEKYLRERRFRVRSFYCQPTYYGTISQYIG